MMKNAKQKFDEIKRNGKAVVPTYKLVQSSHLFAIHLSILIFKSIFLNDFLFPYSRQLMRGNSNSLQLVLSFFNRVCQNMSHKQKFLQTKQDQQDRGAGFNSTEKKWLSRRFRERGDRRRFLIRFRVRILGRHRICVVLSRNVERYLVLLVYFL